MMPSFLSLPIEIRFQIYRELRSFVSPTIKPPLADDRNAFGYCSYAFQSRILETSRQVSSEAKEVFYGENYWTFFASPRSNFSSMLFQMEPMALILPFIRKAHIRFAMFDWLHWGASGIKVSDRGEISKANDGEINKANVGEICQVLRKAPNLRTVKIIWTETCTFMPETCLFPPRRFRRNQDSVRNRILDVLWPLIGLPRTSELQKSIIMVAYLNRVKATDMELEFSECVDEVIALHRSTKAY